MHAYLPDGPLLSLPPPVCQVVDLRDPVEDRKGIIYERSTIEATMVGGRCRAPTGNYEVHKSVRTPKGRGRRSRLLHLTCPRVVQELRPSLRGRIARRVIREMGLKEEGPGGGPQDDVVDDEDI